MFAKIEIRGILEVVTGLHIGASSAFSAIGAVDSPVISDTRTNMPMIPGSSLKGKMRSLLAKKYNDVFAEKPDNDNECLTLLFGNAKKDKVKTSRILFSDMFLSNMDELKRGGLTSAKEVKFENSISRASAIANPRQIERVVRGAKFPVQLIYEVSDVAGNADKDTIIQDFKILSDGFEMLEYDYLGGSGSRGYGRVKFEEFEVECVMGELDEDIIEECQKIMEG
jgi:CRISPR-associated protein Csm3